MTKAPKMTQEQIVEETVAWYGSDPEGRRSQDEVTGGCYYAMTPKKRCAVGRCMTIRDAQALDKSMSTSDMSDTGVSDIDDLESLLKPRYRGHDEDFWRKLQHLHDIEMHWGKRGLSDEGVDYVKTYWPKANIT